MSSQVHAYQRELGKIVNSAELLGVTGITTSAIGCEGFNQITLEMDLVYVNATAVTFTIQVTDDLSGTPTWRYVQSVSVAAGTATCTNLTYSKAIAAANTSWCINLPLNYKAIRFFFDATGGTTDLLTVQGRLGVV